MAESHSGDRSDHISHLGAARVLYWQHATLDQVAFPEQRVRPRRGRRLNSIYPDDATRLV